MAASYPGALKTFTTKTDKVDLVSASHINDLQNEVVAIETELGTDVAGSLTDLKTRLALVMEDNGALNQGTSFPGSPVDGQAFYRTDQNILYVYNGSSWDPQSSPASSSACVVTLSADQDNLVDNTETVINFDTEEFDLGGEFNTTTHIFTPVNTGKYLVNVMIELNEVTASKIYQLRAYNNGALSAYSNNALATTLDTVIYLNRIFAITASQNFDMRIICNSIGGNTVDITGGATHSVMSIARIV